jgi:ABC-type transport system involved in multi-copper enzyme maturation permease subunit
MRTNPVYKREITVSARSFRLALVIMVFNGILALIALLNMYSVVERVKMTADIQYSSFLNLYVFVAVVEFIMLMFIMPALTAGSISGERERQTLDLMLTTTMKPSDIILGKLASSFSTMFIMIVSSFPLLAVSFVYGGITLSDVFLLLLCYVAVALMCGSMGICFSSIFKRSTIATAVTYGVLIVVAAGTYAANTFALSISQMNINNIYSNTMGGMMETASSGGFLYLLLINPVATFYMMISGQTGSNQMANSFNRWFGPHPENFVTKYWVVISLALQLLLALVFIMIAIYAVDRGGVSRRKTEKKVK